MNKKYWFSGNYDPLVEVEANLDFLKAQLNILGTETEAGDLGTLGDSLPLIFADMIDKIENVRLYVKEAEKKLKKQKEKAA